MGNKPLINDDLLPSAVAKQSDKILGLMSAGWTNERHSTYISSMEASFVDQLYGHDKHGIDVKRSHLCGNGFKVIKDGVCNNIRFEGADACKRDFVGGGLPDNLFIRHFKSRNPSVNHRGYVAEDLVDDYGSGTDTVREKVRVHRREVQGFSEENLIEVSDQNFSEEEVDVKANGEPCKKRKPSRAVPNDQPR